MDTPLALVPLDSEPVEPCPVGKCEDCHRRLTDPRSIAMRLGRDCAAKRGITLTTPRVRFGRARHWEDVDGQLDLFEDGGDGMSAHR